MPQIGPDGLAGRDQRSKIRPVRVIDRRGNGNDDELGVAKVYRFGCEPDAGRLAIIDVTGSVLWELTGLRFPWRAIYIQ